MHFNKNLFALTSKVRDKFFLIIGSGFFAGVFTILQAIYLATIINDVFLKNRDLGDEQNNLILFLAVSILKTVAVWGEQYFASIVVKDVKENVRRRLLKKIKALGQTRLSSERTGELTNTIIRGTDTLEKYFSQYLPQLFLSAIIPILILLFVFPRDLLSGIVFILTAPMIPLFMYLIGSIAESLNKKQWRTLSRMSAYFLDVLQGMITLKLFNSVKSEFKKVFEITESFRTATMKVLRVAFLSALVLELLSTISIAIIAVEIGLRLLAGKIEFIDAMFLLVISPEFYLPIRQLGARYHAGLEGVAAFQRIEAILKLKEPETGNIPVNNLNLLATPITFENVSFKYEGRDENALDKASFVIHPAQTTAIVGPTGSGKSTVLNLLLKFILPANGKIKIGNLELNKIDDNEWRKLVSWLPQNPHLFHKTIFENIALAKPDATKEEVIAAARNANIHDFIQSLPDGYNTLAGEKGSKLSGGQIQRIALARAFLKNSPVLLIDEPTANLDPLSEEKILEAMSRLMQGRTVVVIAHRLNTVRNSDNIIVLREGKVAGTGKHEELIDTLPFYRGMFTVYKSA